MTETNRNWAGNITYGAARTHLPRTVAEAQAIVRGASRVRALGSRHSFNRIAATDADLVSLAELNRVVRIDRQARTAVVDGGIIYGQLGAALHAEGFGLHNLASLPHISVAGACATATHGSGDKNGNLATSVAGIEFVNAEGEVVALKRGDDGFEGAVVSLGALGLITSLTLDLVPTFEVRQDLYTELPFASLIDNFDAIMSSAYSVSAFTGWRGEHLDQVWLKSLADTTFGFPPAFFGARAATRVYHPITAMEADPTTVQMGLAGAWHERLPHFRMEFSPSAGDELQSEYFVKRGDAVAALQAIRSIQDRIAPLLLISEIRSVAGDGLWMSMTYGQDSVAIHFTFKPDWPAVSQVLPEIEAALAPFGARPHWGKLFTMPAAEVQSRYERLGDFRALLTRHDPGGKFRNDFVDEYVFG